MNVLILHPERDIADTLADILHNHGYNALPLYDDIDAWVEVRTFVFEVALVSTEMPGCTGIELGDWLWDASNRKGRWLAVIRIGPEEAVDIEAGQSEDFQRSLMRYLFPCLSLPCKIGELVAKVREAGEFHQRMQCISSGPPVS
jgi:CheY-like chemotaxis protein